MPGIRIAAKCRANSPQLVRRDRRADATAADQNSNLSRAVLYGFANLFRVVRIIVGNGAVVSAEVGDFMPGASQFINHSLVKRVTTMISADGNPHSLPQNPCNQWPNNARACVNTLSTLNPKLVNATSPGADAPNRSKQITAPLAPT